MDLYPKINGLYKRDDRGKFTDEFARPEFAYLYDNDWLWTEKVDGTNIRLAWDPLDAAFRGNEVAYIGGRTDNAQIPGPLLSTLVELQQSLPYADVFDGPDSVTLYGEGYGPKIQNGGYYRDDPGFVLFDVKVGNWWLDYPDVVEVGRKLGLDVVPLVFEGPIYQAENIVQKGHLRSVWGDFEPEGLVGRPPVTLFNKRSERILCKVKVKDYIHLRNT